MSAASNSWSKQSLEVLTKEANQLENRQKRQQSEAEGARKKSSVVVSSTGLHITTYSSIHCRVADNGQEVLSIKLIEEIYR
jgi:hypothetical protein